MQETQKQNGSVVQNMKIDIAGLTELKETEWICSHDQAAYFEVYEYLRKEKQG